MSILGISAFFHDSAAAAVGAGGKVLAAVQEECFTRIKGDSGFPSEAISYCVAEASRQKDPIESFVFFEDPLAKFEHILSFVDGEPVERAFSMKALMKWFGTDLEVYRDLEEAVNSLVPDSGGDLEVQFANHHLSHAASAFFPSPHDNAAVIVMDGVGENISTSIWDADSAGIRLVESQFFPNSIGLLYSAVTSFLGFKPNSGEYKVMGLAPFGAPVYRNLFLDNFFNWNSNAQLSVDATAFDPLSDYVTFWASLSRLTGVPRRTPKETLNRVHADLAASIQTLTEEYSRALVEHALVQTGRKNICMAGGVALNAVSNGKLQSFLSLEKKSLWIQPAAGDSGAALGAAYIGSELLGLSKNVGIAGLGLSKREAQEGCLLGPQYSDEEIRVALNTAGALYRELDSGEIEPVVAGLLSTGEIVAWHQGRSEYGPRALGSRSILADPRDPSAHQRLNRAVKKREPFRPFAPAILEEHWEEWFDGVPNSYMLGVVQVRVSQSPRYKRDSFFEPVSGALKAGLVGDSRIPATTHVDMSARPQAVGESSNPRFRRLLENFFEITGCPVLLNTSFNVRGEPIVETPLDALAGLVTTEINHLCIGRFLLRREDQDPLLAQLLTREFPED